MLSIHNLTYAIGYKPLFQEASATLMPKWRVGFVGANGAGKSTLFKLITEELSPEGGEIDLQSGLNLGYIQQEITDIDTPILDKVLSADKERTSLLKQLEENTNPNNTAQIYERLNTIEAHTAPARATAILTGLGFKEAQLKNPLSTLSGGWRMRVALAAVLFQKPDLLLLDEPTNHLDLEGALWLEKHLKAYPYTCIIISHDRHLLNACTDHILHLENKKLTLYKGNYNQFEHTRAEKRNLQQKIHTKQQTQKKHMEAFITRFRAKASKARQAQSRLKALEKMDMVSAVMAEQHIAFTFPQPERLPPPLLSLDDVDVGYIKNTPILKELNLSLDMDDRIALLGQNGNGKSTLIKLLAGELKPQDGRRNAASKLRIGYFSQYQTEELPLEQTPFEAMQVKMKRGPETGVRSRLGQFGFPKATQDTCIASLSGGEKARLLFALMTFDAPQILLLDEPTNHLDIHTREALIQALNTYEGAVIMVSHDPDMVSRVADTLLLVENNNLTPFEGDLEDYKNHILATAREQKRSEKRNLKKDKAKKQEGPSLLKKNPATLRKELKLLEKTMNALTAQKKSLEAEMAEPGYYDDFTNVQKTQNIYANLLKDLEHKEEAWLNLELQLENT